ncbi:heavy metal-binding domain-containing protein [Enterococcus sp. HY326]|uniref:heavy metal-binding domain-containing protein n=1 Tax=Enterococcus sp. HY326 TaxID=2971265 RepID=UPI00223F31DD|nr:heavy metal-binding domain-containing protein [Enterococcus sp. HY326]
MISSTLTSYPGKKVVKDLGIVYGYDDKLRPLRGITAISEYLDQAILDLEKNAEKLGANAVLGISFSMMDKALPAVIGTAVYLEDEE